MSHDSGDMIRQAVILAGGEGTRLRPITYEIPKPLIPVQGLPILSWQVRWFARAGVERVLVIIPARWRQAFQKWKTELAEPITVELWEESEPMGTMGALTHHLSDRFGDGPLFVTNGDELKGLDLERLAAFHASAKRAATIALIQVPNPSDYGVAEMQGDRIAAFHEKPARPPSNLVSSGLYVIEPTTFKEAPHDKTFLMFEKDLFPQLAAAGRLGGCALEGPWFDCGTMERWERAMREWKEPRQPDGSALL